MMPRTSRQKRRTGVALKKFHYWGQLSEQLKEYVIDRMDNSTRLNLALCAKLEKRLVDDSQLHIRWVAFCQDRLRPPSAPQHFWLARSDYRMGSKVSNNKYMCQPGETTAVKAFLNLYACSPWTYISAVYFDFCFSSPFGLMMMEEMVREATARKITLHIEYVLMIVTPDTSVQLVQQVLELIDRPRFYRLSLTNATDEMITMLSQTGLLGHFDEMELRDIETFGPSIHRKNFNPDIFLHLSKIDIATNVLTPENAWKFIQAFQSKNKGDKFNISVLQEIQIQEIFNLFDPDRVVNLEEIRGRSGITHQFPMLSNPNLVLCVEFHFCFLYGVVCDPKILEEDAPFTKPLVNKYKYHFWMTKQIINRRPYIKHEFCTLNDRKELVWKEGGEEGYEQATKGLNKKGWPYPD